MGRPGNGASKDSSGDGGPGESSGGSKTFNMRGEG